MAFSMGTNPRSTSPDSVAPSTSGIEVDGTSCGLGQVGLGEQRLLGERAGRAEEADGGLGAVDGAGRWGEVERSRPPSLRPAPSRTGGDWWTRRARSTTSSATTSNWWWIVHRRSTFPHQFGEGYSSASRRSGVVTTRRNRPRPVFSMRIGALRSSRRRFSRMSRLSKLSRNSRQLERRVEPHLAVGELDAALVVVLAEQRPQDAAGHPLDEVVAVEEGAAVDRRRSAHARRRRRGAGSASRRRRRRRAGVGAVAARSSARLGLDGAGRPARPPRASARLVAVVERDGLGALDHEDADELAERHRGHREPALAVGQPGQRDLVAGADVAVLLERPPHRARVLAPSGAGCRRASGVHRAAAMPIDAVAHARPPIRRPRTS